MLEGTCAITLYIVIDICAHTQGHTECVTTRSNAQDGNTLGHGERLVNVLAESNSMGIPRAATPVVKQVQMGDKFPRVIAITLVLKFDDGMGKLQHVCEFC